MSTHFNKIVDKHLSFTDFSLISEASDINDLSFESKDSPKSLINKQVRFNSDININSFLNGSVISDASLLESESKFYKISVNSTQKSGYQENSSNTNIYSGEKGNQKQSYPLVDNNERTSTDELTVVDSKSKQIVKDDDHNDNTSIWSSDTELSDDVITSPSSSVNKKESFFKTIDGLSSGLSNDSSVRVDKIIPDGLSGNNRYGSVQCQPLERANLSRPVANSSKRLEDEINSLEANLQYRQTNLTQSAKELAAKKLAEQLNLNEKFTNNNISTFVSQTPVELTAPLNVTPETELYPALTRLSVRDETILISEQRKLTAIRKRVGVDKIKRKMEDGLPEPDIMEFFDTSKHIFKSVNLSLGPNLINLKPKLSLANKRLYSIFRDRDLLSQFQ